jgi:hypothetical protein
MHIYNQINKKLCGLIHGRKKSLIITKKTDINQDI